MFLLYACFYHDLILLSYKPLVNPHAPSCRAREPWLAIMLGSPIKRDCGNNELAHEDLRGFCHPDINVLCESRGGVNAYILTARVTSFEYNKLSRRVLRCLQQAQLTDE